MSCNGAIVTAVEIKDYIYSHANKQRIILKDFYLVLNILCNFIFISHLTEEGYGFILKNDAMSIIYNDIFIAFGTLINDVYVLNSNFLFPVSYNSISACCYNIRDFNFDIIDSTILVGNECANYVMKVISFIRF